MPSGDSKMQFLARLSSVCRTILLAVSGHGAERCLARGRMGRGKREIRGDVTGEMRGGKVGHGWGEAAEPKATG